MMITPISDITIRKYSPQDREAVRMISYQTSFLGQPELFLANKELVADLLTLYFTDYEPESCFVAVENSVVIGYIIGSKNYESMKNVFNKIILWPFIKKVFLQVNQQALKILFRAAIGLIRGEFWSPEYQKEYPSILHINIDKNHRRAGLGSRLLRIYQDYLKENSVTGVHLGTMTERAKEFFIQNGFQVLYKSKRSYLRSEPNQVVPFYVMGKHF